MDAGCRAAEPEDIRVQQGFKGPGCLVDATMERTVRGTGVRGRPQASSIIGSVPGCFLQGNAKTAGIFTTHTCLGRWVWELGGVGWSEGGCHGGQST